MEYGVKKLVRIKKKKAVRIRERKRVVRRNEECGADSHKMWWWGAALSTLYHHCIASSPENAKNLQHGTGQKTHCHDKEYVTNIQPCKLFKLRRCGKKILL